ncbi:hypothetical protein LzC2_23170 [Planctomycetes bacterium LzC2]|uniref:Uncharacterized protein n=1 Tax=Alienimonas chondri TaxID=2681879 RepID=A0ABX1VHI7_9PLAN|nr:hypothetical protein [Alienimonas chondri]
MRAYSQGLRDRVLADRDAGDPTANVAAATASARRGCGG